MRIEQGGVTPRPEKGNGVQEDSRKKSGKSASAAKTGDSVNISNEARRLQSGRTDDMENRGGDLAGDRSDLKAIHERIDSEYYDSPEATAAVAARLLEVFGL